MIPEKGGTPKSGPEPGSQNSVLLTCESNTKTQNQ